MPCEIGYLTYVKGGGKITNFVLTGMCKGETQQRAGSHKQPLCWMAGARAFSRFIRPSILEKYMQAFCSIELPNCQKLYTQFFCKSTLFAKNGDIPVFLVFCCQILAKLQIDVKRFLHFSENFAYNDSRFCN